MLLIFLCFWLGAHLSLQQSRGHYGDVQQALVKKVYYWQEQHSSCSDSSSLHLALSPKSCHFVHKFFTKHLAALLRSRNLAYFGVEIFLIHCGQWAIVIHSFKWKISRVCVRKYKFFFFFKVFNECKFNSSLPLYCMNFHNRPLHMTLKSNYMYMFTSLSGTTWWCPGCLCFSQPD